MLDQTSESLRAQNEQLRDRVQQLEGLSTEPVPALALEKQQERIFSILLKREFVSTEGMMTFLYGDRPDSPDEVTLRVQISRIRKTLKTLGICGEIKNARDRGYYLTSELKAAIKKLVAANQNKLWSER